jgi:C-terminal processing protease CtpA/Prc
MCLEMLCDVSARGFGMRMVSGKTGSDGRLFPAIVWTMPGGAAEKGGLKQGDKVSNCDTSVVY